MIIRISLSQFDWLGLKEEGFEKAKLIQKKTFI